MKLRPLLERRPLVTRHAIHVLNPFSRINRGVMPTLKPHSAEVTHGSCLVNRLPKGEINVGAVAADELEKCLTFPLCNRIPFQLDRTGTPASHHLQFLQNLDKMPEGK